MSKIIKVELLQDGKLPIKAHKTDAGFDLFASDDFWVHPGQVVKHPLNVRLSLPESTYAEITSKSGNGSKGLLVYAGIIDESYRGIIHVVMTNLNHRPHYPTPESQPVLVPGDSLHFLQGQKIAQMIMHPYSNDYVIEQVYQIDQNTSRGSGGFGSSGSF